MTRIFFRSPLSAAEARSDDTRNAAMTIPNNRSTHRNDGKPRPAFETLGPGGPVTANRCVKTKTEMAYRQAGKRDCLPSRLNIFRLNFSSTVNNYRAADFILIKLWSNRGKDYGVSLARRLVHTYR